MRKKRKAPPSASTQPGGRWDFNRASHSFIKMELTDSENSAMTFMYKFAKVFGGEVNASALRAIKKAFPVAGQEDEVARRIKEYKA